MARVTRAIASELSKFMDVGVLAVDRFCDAELNEARNSRPLNYSVFKNPYEYDLYGEKAFVKVCNEMQPSHIVIYQDLWNISRYIDAIHSINCKPHIIAYCPVDGEFNDLSLLTGLGCLDALVTTSMFSKKQLAGCNGILGCNSDIHVIPHGIAVSDFQVAGSTVDRAAYRKLLFPERPDIWQSPILLNGNRHQSRKRLKDTLLGFSLFCKSSSSSACLYLHWGHENSGDNLKQIASDLGITDRVLFRSDSSFEDASSISKVYNACDIGINTSLGEGWGLVSFEHAATGAPQIVPSHSACLDQWEGYAVFLDRLEGLKLNRYCGGQKTSHKQISSVIKLLVDDTEAYRHFSQKSIEQVNRPLYRWSIIAEQWHALLYSLNQQRELLSENTLGGTSSLIN